MDRIDYLYKRPGAVLVWRRWGEPAEARPCIEVVGGKMGVGKKYRGNVEKIFPVYAADKLAGKSDEKGSLFSLPTPDAAKETVAQVRQKVEEFLNLTRLWKPLLVRPLLPTAGQKPSACCLLRKNKKSQRQAFGSLFHGWKAGFGLIKVFCGMPTSNTKNFVGAGICPADSYYK